jgi:hypothetical protein
MCQNLFTFFKGVQLSISSIISFKASLVHLPCSISIGTLFLVVDLIVYLPILSGVFCYPLLFVRIIHFVAYKVYYALGQPSTSQPKPPTTWQCLIKTY